MDLCKHGDKTILVKKEGAQIDPEVESNNVRVEMMHPSIAKYQFWVRCTHCSDYKARGASGNYKAWGASGNYEAWGASGNYEARGASGRISVVCLTRTSRYPSKRRSWLVPLLPTFILSWLLA